MSSLCNQNQIIVHVQISFSFVSRVKDFLWGHMTVDFLKMKLSEAVNKHRCLDCERD